MKYLQRTKVISFSMLIISFISIMPFVFELGSDNPTVEAANSIIVDKSGGGDYTKIKDAVDAANPGDTIYVRGGTYKEWLLLTKTITLIGNSTKATVIEGSGAGDVINLQANWVNISNFHITNGGSGFSNAGIELNGAENCHIFNNNVSSNLGIGIKLASSSQNNLIENNNCSANGYTGIYLRDSSTNTVINNTCILNSERGIMVYNSLSCTIKNNIIKSNNYGIVLSISSINTVTDNTIIDNDYGIFLDNSMSCTISNNLVKTCTYTGIRLDTDASNNYFYHNSIISNPTQADDGGSNFWSSNEEGNYWSDYFGLDNGAGGRTQGDGIGDTNLPHFGLDNYPFIDMWGWLRLEGAVLLDPGALDLDGDYQLSWNATEMAKDYILEEDSDDAFADPTAIYDGPDLSFQVRNRSIGTYFYRLMAYNEYYTSPWSNHVNITVDWAPDAPTNLKVTVYPPGNALNLSWDPNLVDTEKYELYYKTTSSWELFDMVMHPAHTYHHEGLTDGIQYYYRILAVDKRGQPSNYSEIKSAVPSDSVAPAAPEDLLVKSTTFDSISLVWISPSESDLKGYKIYRSKTSSPADWGEPIGSTKKGDEEYIDTNLDELTTYYYSVNAYDEVPNYSVKSNTASGTTEMGPRSPEINNSVEDFDIPEDSVDDSSINLYRWFMDANNDLLDFRYEGDEHIDITVHKDTGKVVLEPESNWNGEEVLTFYASDGVFDEISDSVKITVTPVNDPPGPAKIVEPEDNKKLDDGQAVTLSGSCDDPDLDYGDALVFKWSSNVTGELGNGKVVENVVLPICEHLITLAVTDSNEETSTSSVTVVILETSFSDTDGDGIPNIWERNHGLDPGDPSDIDKDLDSDGLSNIKEYELGTDPNESDTDNDGIPDGDEIKIYLTNVTNPDTDSDGHYDGSDDYPLDPFKWQKEIEQVDDDQQTGYIFIIIIVVVIVLILLLLIIRPKIFMFFKHENKENEDPAEKTALSIPPPQTPEPEIPS